MLKTKGDPCDSSHRDLRKLRRWPLEAASRRTKDAKVRERGREHGLPPSAFLSGSQMLSQILVTRSC
jgi:hypothetical protein